MDVASEGDALKEKSLVQVEESVGKASPPRPESPGPLNIEIEGTFLSKKKPGKAAAKKGAGKKDQVVEMLKKPADKKQKAAPAPKAKSPSPAEPAVASEQ